MGQFGLFSHFPRFSTASPPFPRVPLMNFAAELVDWKNGTRLPSRHGPIFWPTRKLDSGGTLTLAREGHDGGHSEGIVGARGGPNTARGTAEGTEGAQGGGGLSEWGGGGGGRGQGAVPCTSAGGSPATPPRSPSNAAPDAPRRGRTPRPSPRGPTAPAPAGPSACRASAPAARA